MQDKQNELRQGLNVKGSEMKLSAFMASWLEQIKANLRLRTVEGYATTTRVHILPHLGEYKLIELRPDLIDRFYANLLRKMTLPPTPSTAATACWYAALEKAVKYSYLLRNPAHGAIVPKAPTAEMSVLDEEQVSRFLVAANTSRYEALFHLAVATGMRQSELLGLKLGGFILDEGHPLRAPAGHAARQRWVFRT